MLCFYNPQKTFAKNENPLWMEIFTQIISDPKKQGEVSLPYPWGQDGGE